MTVSRGLVFNERVILMACVLSQNEITFNSLPLSTRIQQSRKFVRDVTFLSTRCDALVITGSSNVGRLMSLLFGARERGMKSRIRSLDTR